jgi:hypothetical protein
MRKSLPLVAATMLAALPAFSQPQPISQFKPQEIDKSLTVGYAVRLTDINGDKKPDILVCDSARVIWFENPTWKLHTVVGKVSKSDNVCIAVHDIDGDGKVDIALGAEWEFGNTKSAGSLQWLRQGENIDEPWKVFPIWPSEPTLHRINFADVDGDGKAELVVGPLKGRNSTQANNFAETGSRFMAFPIPADPTKGPWEPRVLTDQLHVLHNFLPVNLRGSENARGKELLTASYEGVSLVTVGPDYKATVAKLGEGDQSNPKKERGSSEVKLGRLKGGAPFIATIEPFHGTAVVVYTPPPGASGADLTSGQALWTRTVIDPRLHGGHGLWCADLDGDGADEIVAGWRDKAGDEKPGIRIYKATMPSDDKSGRPTWQTHTLDDGGVAVEDLACLDLNDDGKIDIVAVGRATKNVKIYWNQGAPGK